MKRKSLFCVFMSIIFCFSIFVYNSYLVTADNEKIYLGGIPAGFSIQTRGAHIVGLCDVVTKNGVESPSKDAEFQVGDVIIAIDGVQTNSALDIENNVKGKNNIIVQLKRSETEIVKNVKTAKDISGSEKLGVFIKDDVSGIGTITFIRGNRFASLGHPIVDADGRTLNILGGNLYSCDITGCVKGERGNAGELRGVFIRNNTIATIEKNTNFGVYGTINEHFNFSNLKEIDVGNAVVGDATAYSTISGSEPTAFSISIIKIDNTNNDKNFVIKITDKKLIDATNGIVQGMSGSPIVQNGKLVGAITHVFINDPTRGFGLSINNMINN